MNAIISTILSVLAMIASLTGNVNDVALSTLDALRTAHPETSIVMDLPDGNYTVTETEEESFVLDVIVPETETRPDVTPEDTADNDLVEIPDDTDIPLADSPVTDETEKENEADPVFPYPAAPEDYTTTNTEYETEDSEANTAIENVVENETTLDPVPEEFWPNLPCCTTVEFIDGMYVLTNTHGGGFYQAICTPDEFINETYTWQ